MKDNLKALSVSVMSPTNLSIESIWNDICSYFINKDAIYSDMYLMNSFYPHFVRKQVNGLSMYVHMCLSLLLYVIYEKHFLMYWQIRTDK